jgi:hypothetical protein
MNREQMAQIQKTLGIARRLVGNLERLTPAGSESRVLLPEPRSGGGGKTTTVTGAETPLPDPAEERKKRALQAVPMVEGMADLTLSRPMPETRCEMGEMLWEAFKLGRTYGVLMGDDEASGENGAQSEVDKDEGTKPLPVVAQPKSSGGLTLEEIQKRRPESEGASGSGNDPSEATRSAPKDDHGNL